MEVGGSEFFEMPPNIQLHLWKLAGRNSPEGETDKDLGEVPLQRRDGQSMRGSLHASSKEDVMNGERT